MSDLEVGIAILCLTAIVLIVLFVTCRSFDLMTYMSAWIYSAKEEKVGLTRSKGHYNANGYLVHSSSDIHLGTSGSFKRFDSVDKDFKMTVDSTSFTEWSAAEIDHSIRPQPISISSHPVQLSINDALSEKQASCKPCEGSTTISPIPRPVSSINMSALASNTEFPYITPPPRTHQTHGIPISKSMTVIQDSQQVGYVTADDMEIIPSVLKRAVSCESVCSDSSVALGDLEEANVTGYLCIGLEYDSESSDFIVNVLEAKDLAGPLNEANEISSYVRVFLLPDKATNVQTKISRSASSPSYKERFLFRLSPREQSQKSLCFHLYCIDSLLHILIGEGEIRLSDVSLRQPVTTWVTLTDTGQQGTEFGELMFSLSYLPTAERLTVVVVKARKLKFVNEIGDSFVKVYLLQHGKKLHKKKTSTKKSEKCPIFNEAMMFSVPAHTLQTIQLRLTVSEAPRLENNFKNFSLGHVIIGAQASGKSLYHWNQMLTALRKPVAMWHPLRK